MTRTEFEVRKDDLRQHRFREVPEPALEDGDVELVVEKFALTANNVTYALVGETMSYWNFFPAEDPEWGHVPVWGFGRVIRTNRDDVREGERLYGYYPMATTLVISPKSVSREFVIDGAAHRQPLPPFYNQYNRNDVDPFYAPDTEAIQMLFRPLFATGWLIDQFLIDEKFFGAKQVVITSASSKTAIAVAQGLEKEDVKVVGLTSSGNRDFVVDLGLYDETVTYDALDALAVEPTTVVDMNGKASHLEALRARLGDALKYTCLVGLADWEGAGSMAGNLGKFFFAPDHGARRVKELGAAAYLEKMADAWNAFLPAANRALEIEERSGREAVARAYDDVIENRVAPSRGIILSLRE